MNSIFIVLICLVLSAFFSGVEIAYISLNKIHIELEKKQRDIFSKILSKLTKNPSRFIATMLVGNSLTLVVYGFYFGQIVLQWLFPEYVGTDDIPAKVILSQTLISTLIILITAEFLPKVFFQIYSSTLFKVCILPSYIFYWLFLPITSFIVWLIDLITIDILKTGNENTDRVFSKLDLGYYLSEQIETASPNEDMDTEIEMFRNALCFSELKAREVMVPRPEILAVDVRDTPKNILSSFIDSGLSKILIYNESIDDIIGYVNSSELFKKPKTIKSVLRSIEFIPETMLINNVLNLLIKKCKSIAVVLDEFGGTSGMITVEDIIEQLFGKIQDEHDSEDLLEEKISDREYKFSARLEVDYINKVYKLNIPEDGDYDTLSGLIVSVNGDIPDAGEKVSIGNLRFTVLEVSDTKIDVVHLKLSHYKSS